MAELTYAFTINAENEYLPLVMICGRDTQVLFLGELLATVEGSSALFEGSLNGFNEESFYRSAEVEWRDGAWQIMEAFEIVEAAVREAVEGAE